MRLWRIAQARYEALDGEGAQRWGGRWNSPGRPVVYTSMTASLAVLEKLVWVGPGEFPENLRLFEIDVPDGISPEHLDPERLPHDWKSVGSPACREIGDEWLAAESALMLVVPSTLLNEERNVLINPRHGEARQVRVARSRPFSFDPRLVSDG